ncbi:hypothetical protein ABPG74_005229 [Tetrahymena malaccensis]
MKITLLVLVLLFAYGYCDIPSNNCPDNFEFVDGQCQQCKPGYQSGSGYPCMKCQAGTYFIKPNNCGPCGQGMTSLFGGFCFKCPVEATITSDQVCQCPTNYCLINISSTPQCTLCQPQNSQNTNNNQNSNNVNNTNLGNQDNNTFSSILIQGILAFLILIF